MPIGLNSPQIARIVPDFINMAHCMLGMVHWEGVLGMVCLEWCAGNGVLGVVCWEWRAGNGVLGMAH